MGILTTMKPVQGILGHFKSPDLVKPERHVSNTEHATSMRHQISVLKHEKCNVMKTSAVTVVSLELVRTHLILCYNIYNML